MIQQQTLKRLSNDQFFPLNRPLSIGSWEYFFNLGKVIKAVQNKTNSLCTVQTLGNYRQLWQ